MILIRFTIFNVKLFTFLLKFLVFIAFCCNLLLYYIQIFIKKTFLGVLKKIPAYFSKKKPLVVFSESASHTYIYHNFKKLCANNRKLFFFVNVLNLKEKQRAVSVSDRVAAKVFKKPF